MHRFCGHSANEYVRITPEWKEYSLLLDYKPFYPALKAVRFCMMGKGTFYVTNVRMIQNRAKPATKTAVVLSPIHPAMSYERGSSLTLSASGVDGEASIEYSVLNPDGELLESGSGASPFELNLKNSGAQFLVVTVRDMGRIVAQEKYRLLVSGKPPVGKNSHFVGLNAPVTIRNVLPKEQQEYPFAGAAEIGIGIFHHYLNIKNMRDMLHKGDYQNLVYQAQKNGVATLFTFNDSALLIGKANTRFPAPDDPDGETAEKQTKNASDEKRFAPENMSLWQDYIGAICKKFNNSVKFFEICNEPNVYMNSQEYQDVLDKTIPVVRANAPEATIIAGSVVNATGSALWNDTIKRNDYDQFSFHPYRFHDNNPHRSGFARAVRFAQSGAGTKPIHMTEEYRSAGPTLAQERDEANAYARILNTALVLKCVGYHRHHNLYLDSAITPNLCGGVVNTFMSLLSQADALELFDCGKGVMCALYMIKEPSKDFLKRWSFSTDGAVAVAAVWRNDHQMPKFAPFQIRGTRVVNLYGNSAKPVLGRDLLYIISKTDDATKLKEKIISALK